MKIFQWNKVNAVIAGATAALIALVLLQAQWLLHSKNLIEEQFNQKLSMALCMAVTDLEDGPKTCIAEPKVTDIDFLFNELDIQDTATDLQDEPKNCIAEPKAVDIDFLFNGSDIQITAIPPQFAEQEVRKALDHALDFYDIHLPYDIEIFDKRETCASPSLPSCCSLGRVAGYNDQNLHITFPNRTQYFLGQMSFMISAAILILLFVSTVFGLATYYLIQQQKIGERNKDFFNNMAHEFKTPLTNIILANNLLAKKQPQLSHNRFVSITQKEASKLMHQVERVLYLANMERNNYSLNKEPLGIAALLAEVVEGMAIQIAEKEAAIKVDVPEDLMVQGDKFHLSNAFRNLIENALKYAVETPKIDISSAMKDNGVLLLFKDNGIGIAKSEQAIVFDKFQRVGTGDIHNEKGFGLGLAYVKKVVELHQGFIHIFSELNKGSRFDLYLPSG